MLLKCILCEFRIMLYRLVGARYDFHSSVILLMKNSIIVHGFHVEIPNGLIHLKFQSLCERISCNGIDLVWKHIVWFSEGGWITQSLRYIGVHMHEQQKKKNMKRGLLGCFFFVFSVECVTYLVPLGVWKHWFPGKGVFFFVFVCLFVCFCKNLAYFRGSNLMWNSESSNSFEGHFWNLCACIYVHQYIWVPLCDF